MPGKSTRKHWMDGLTETYSKQQRAKLKRELESDDSVSSMSEGSDGEAPADLDNLDTFDAAVSALQQELEDLSLDLEMEILDFDLPTGRIDVDMEDPPSPTGSTHSSPTSSDVEEDLESLSRGRLLMLLQYMKDNQVLEPQPPNPKASQLHLLDHWADHGLRNFCSKLRVHPTTFQ